MMQIKIFFMLLVGLVVWAKPGTAHAAQYQFSGQNGKNQIKFYSKTPVEVFEGEAREFSGRLKFNPSSRKDELEGTIHVAVSHMATGIPLRDTHMKSPDWMNENAFPQIQFSLLSHKSQVKRKGKNQWYVLATGKMEIKGVTREIRAPIRIVRTRGKNGDEILIKGRFKLTLKDFDIRGPRAMEMIGVRVSPEVEVVLKLVGLAPQVSQPKSKKYSW